MGNIEISEDKSAITVRVSLGSYEPGELVASIASRSLLLFWVPTELPEPSRPDEDPVTIVRLEKDVDPANADIRVKSDVLVVRLPIKLSGATTS